MKVKKTLKLHLRPILILKYDYKYVEQQKKGAKKTGFETYWHQSCTTVMRVAG